MRLAWYWSALALLVGIGVGLGAQRLTDCDLAEPGAVPPQSRTSEHAGETRLGADEPGSPATRGRESLDLANGRAAPLPEATERAAAAGAGGGRELPARSPSATPHCPTCPPPTVCPPPVSCPTGEQLCRADRTQLADTRRELEQARRELTDRAGRDPRDRFAGGAARERRAEAAARNDLLVEFPSWDEDYTMAQDWADRIGLGAEDKSLVEERYRTFHHDALERLRGIYAELVGDPDAGRDSTISALLHNIMGLSPREACQERILAMLQALSSGQPLPVATDQSPPCEEAILFLFATVDALEQEVVDRWGETALRGLWGGSSSFTYGAGSAAPGTPR